MIVIIYGKMTLNHIDEDHYEETSLYSFLDKELVYSAYPELKQFLIDDNNVNSAQDLIEQSDFILLIKNDGKKELIGNAIINHVTVKHVWKGDRIKVNDTIRIYDLVHFWNERWSEYLGGSTPLNQDDEYIVLLKKGHYPTIPDSYAFASIKYGHIVTNRESKDLINYEKYTLKVDSIKQYDYISTKNEEESQISHYRIIKQKLLDELQK